MLKDIQELFETLNDQVKFYIMGFQNESEMEKNCDDILRFYFAKRKSIRYNLLKAK
jgi:hypothetical protein